MVRMWGGDTCNVHHAAVCKYGVAVFRTEGRMCVQHAAGKSRGVGIQ